MAAALPCYVGLRGRRVKLPNRAQRIRRLFDVNDDLSRDVCEAGHHREMAPALRASSRRDQGPPARFSSSTYAATARPAQLLVARDSPAAQHIRPEWCRPYRD